MYPDINNFTPAAVFSTLRHFVTDIIHQTIAIVGHLAAGAIVIGIGVLVIVAVWYAILSLEGHRLERPADEL